MKGTGPDMLILSLTNSKKSFGHIKVRNREPIIKGIKPASRKALSTSARFLALNKYAIIKGKYIGLLCN